MYLIKSEFENFSVFLKSPIRSETPKSSSRAVWAVIKDFRKLSREEFTSVSDPDPDGSWFFSRSGSGFKKYGSGSVH